LDAVKKLKTDAVALHWKIIASEAIDDKLRVIFQKPTKSRLGWREKFAPVSKTPDAQFFLTPEILLINSSSQSSRPSFAKRIKSLDTPSNAIGA
jgi:hypothetical protein